MPSSDVDDLYGVDPNAFVATRDQLVRELRAEGEKARAREVKLLRRPSVPIWAFNQVARVDRATTRAVLDTAAAARRVQIEVMNGSDPAALRAALAERRSAMEDVIAEAAAIIEQSGRSSASYERELADTLNAIVSNDELAEQLQSGRLAGIPSTSDESADVFAGLPEPTRPRAREKSDELVAAAKRQMERARTRVREADEAHREALLARDRARRAFEDAQRAVERTDRDRQAAQAAFDETSD